ncbi:DUF3667 domain-containing protein [Aquimarina sp. 2304DJ70-9]|uniref:DUF3667 domain-containing protein n=1 Tax=Aquimarina penaris TaxID=3231044 RepID=UPI0034619607
MSELITITNCKNCGQQIEVYNFCPDCGARKITKRITFKNLIAEFIDRFLNLDNSFFKTFIHLFTKPEVVIDGYIHGLRKRYVNAFGYFAISVTITGLYGFIVKDRIFELTSATMSSLLSEEALESQMTGLDMAFQYQSVLSFILIPILALLSRLVFLNYKKYNLTEHFVIYLYAYSHIVGITALLQIPITFLIDSYFIMSFSPFIVYFFYIGYVLKRLYGIDLKKILLKTLLFLMILLGSYLLLIIVSLLFHSI